MTDWAPRSVAYQGIDMGWLASSFGVDMGIPIELDLALFDTVTNFPNGFLPPGIVIAKTGSVWGHYDPGTVVNESYSIPVNATGGTFTITFDGETTAAIAFNVSAANLKLALEGLSNVNVNDFTVTGGPGSAAPVPYVITAAVGGQYADQDLPNMTTGVGSLTGGTATAAVTVTAGGGAGAATGGAGLDVAGGHLLFPVSTIDANGVQRTTGPLTAALFTRGRVNETKLPTNHGLDAAAKTALRHIEYLTL